MKRYKTVPGLVSAAVEHETPLRKQVLMLQLAPAFGRDPSDTIIFWSRGAELMFGFATEEALGRVSRELLKTQFPEPFEQLLAGLSAGREWRGELCHTRRDGSNICVLSHWVPQLDRQRHLEAIVEIDSDITERKRAEAAQARLAAIVESSEDAIISKSLDGVVTSWNQGAERIFGYKPEEAIGRPISFLIPAGRANEEPGILERLKHGRHIRHYETVRLRKDGTLVDVSLTVSPIKDASGRTIGASKIARDITERKRAHKLMREVESQLRARVDAIPQLVWTCGPDGACDFISRSWLQYTGTNQEDNLGYGWLNVVHADDIAGTTAAWEEALAAGRRFQAELRLRNFIGAYRWHLARAWPTNDAHGHVLKWFGTCTDIHDILQPRGAQAGAQTT